MRKTLSTIAVATILVLSGAPAMAGGTPPPPPPTKSCTDTVAGLESEVHALTVTEFSLLSTIDAQQAKIAAQQALIRHLRHRLAAK